jgi:hypothetical protein
MINKKLIGTMFIVILFSVNKLIAQPYDWPVKPGTSEWSALTTHSGMLAALQIPETTLKKMTTKDLVETCLNYPLLFEMWAYDSFQNGLDQIIKNFNGLQELITRTDAGIELLKKYQKINSIEINKIQDAMEKEQFKVDVCQNEALLSHKSIIKNMNKIERLTLLKESLEKNKMLMSTGTYPFYCYDSNTLVIVRLLLSENENMLNSKTNENKNLAFFIRHGCNASNKTLKDVVETANLYFTNNN